MDIGLVRHALSMQFWLSVDVEILCTKIPYCYLLLTQPLTQSAQSNASGTKDF